MYTEEYKLQTIGFELSKGCLSEFKKLMEEIIDIAPHNSFVSVTLLKIGNTYEGLMEVNSFIGPFKAVYKASTPDEVLQKVTEITIQKLRVWYRQRYIRPAFKKQDRRKPFDYDIAS